MMAIALNRKKLLLWCSLVLVVTLGGWAVLSHRVADRSPVEIRVNRENVTSKRQQVTNRSDGKEFFVDCRLSRDRICSKQIELLQEIANNPDSSPDVRDRAQKDIMQITENLGKETEIEKLIIARGFKDAVVMLQARMATVIVQAPTLLRSDTERIAEIVAGATGLEPGSVFVIARP